MLVKFGDPDAVYSRDKISRPVMVYEVYTKLSEFYNRVSHCGRGKTRHEVRREESFSLEKCIFLDENAIFMDTIQCCYDFH